MKVHINQELVHILDTNNYVSETVPLPQEYPGSVSTTMIIFDFQLFKFSTAGHLEMTVFFIFNVFLMEPFWWPICKPSINFIRHSFLWFLFVFQRRPFWKIGSNPFRHFWEERWAKVYGKEELEKLEQKQHISPTGFGKHNKIW